jgi:O-antigen ligase
MTGNLKNTYLAGMQSFNYLAFLLLILALPTHESPKFIFWSLFVLTSLLSGSLNLRPLLRNWDALDTLIIIWMFSGLVIAYFSGIKYKEWGGAADTIIFTSVLLILRRRHFTDAQLKFIYYTILLSTLTASLVALWQFFNLHNMEFLEFHSVGHVNHTAIYLALSLAASMAMVHAYWKSASAAYRFFHIVIFSTIALTLVVTDSRAAVFAALLFVASGLVMFRKQIMPTVLMTLIVIGLVIGNYVINRGGVIEKQIDQVERGIFFAARLKIWRSALLTWQEFPLYGTGIKNFNHVDLKQLMEWCAERRSDCNVDQFMPYPHGHSLYINTLAERGLFGLLVIMVNLAVLAYLVYRYRPSPASSGVYMMLWTGACGAIFLNLVIGLLNTTLHHEHALLSVILIGLFLGKLGQFPGQQDSSEVRV